MDNGQYLLYVRHTQQRIPIIVMLMCRIRAKRGSNTHHFYEMNKVMKRNGPLGGSATDISLSYCIEIYLRHQGNIAFLDPVPGLLINATLRDLGPLNVNLITFSIELQI